jgi:hypothetical protein
MVKQLLVLLLLLPISLWSQPGAVISLQPERIETGDTTVLLLFVNGSNAEPGDVDFFPWSDHIPAQNILRRGAWKRSGAQWIRRFTIIAFDSASFKLPPLKVKLSTGTVLETNGVSLLVFPTPVGRELTDMAKIRDIWREPESWVDYWLYGAGVLALLLTLVWWWWKNRRKPVQVPVAVQAPTPEPAPQTAAEEAIAKLLSLQSKQHWKHNRVKEHYVDFSLIVRGYLENQFHIPALESTTLELKTQLRQTSASETFQNQIETLLHQADMVKYAQSRPDHSVHENIIEKTITIIKTSQSLLSSGRPQESPLQKTPPYSSI